jgi:hypothetical protein
MEALPIDKKITQRLLIFVHRAEEPHGKAVLYRMHHQETESWKFIRRTREIQT